MESHADSRSHIVHVGALVGRRPAERSTRYTRQSLSASSHEERAPHAWISGAGRTLSRRERDCLTHLELGLSTSETAAALGVSRSTLNAHLASARQKLGARNTAQALLIFARLRTGHRQPRIRQDCETSLTERQISLADRLSRCGDSFLGAWLALHDYAAALGIRTINFWIVADPYSLIDDSTCAMWSSLPEENLRLYREMGGMTTDPCGLHVVRATAPLIVDPELIRASFDGMPAPVRRTATALIESHLNRMLSVNHRDPVTGAATGCLFSFDVRDYHEFERLVAATGEELTRTTALFWDHVQRAKLLAEVPGLSRRQREALVLLARGYSLTQLAEELRVSVRAAEKLAAAARSKLGARTNAQAVYRAMVYRTLA